jgi:excinuclease ABC subunit B
MRAAIDETNRRRTIQKAHNEAHGIEPRSILKKIADLPGDVFDADYVETPIVARKAERAFQSVKETRARIRELDSLMKEAAGRLEYERAAELRDEMRALESELLEIRARA